MDKFKVYRYISGDCMVLLGVLALLSAITFFVLGGDNLSYDVLEMFLLSVFLFIVAIFVFKNKKWAKIIAIIIYSITVLFLLFYTIFFFSAFFEKSSSMNFPTLTLTTLVSLILSIIPLIFTILELIGNRKISNVQKMKVGKTKLIKKQA